MKLLVPLAACLLLLGGSTLGSAAAVHHGATVAGNTRLEPRLLARFEGHRVLGVKVLLARPHTGPAQTGSTATPTVTTTPTGTTTATPTPTTSPYPDPLPILQNAGNVLNSVHSAHFEDIFDDTSTTQNTRIDVLGDATCAPAMKGTVNAKATVPGTTENQSLKFSFVVIKKKQWLKAKSTHSKWSKSSKDPFAQVGLTESLVFPQLGCQGFASSSSGTSSDAQQSGPQLKDVVNLGPETLNKTSVWHLRGQLVGVDSQTGQPFAYQVDFYISQDHFLLLKQVITITDPTTKETLVVTTLMSKFGEKVKITDPTKKKK